MPEPDLRRCLLVGGASLLGKSTCAAILGRRLGARVETTDTLARHPGRPWPVDRIAPHVAEHFGGLAPEDLLASVLAHYRDVIWPRASALIATHLRAPGTGVLVVEGTALLPELVATLESGAIAAVWIVGDDALVRGRMYAEAGYAGADARRRRLIDSFFARNVLINAMIAETARTLGLAVVEARAEDDAAATAALCAERLRSPADPV